MAEQVYMIVIYMTLMTGLVILSVNLILAIKPSNAIYFAPLIFVLSSIWIMIQWRCKVEGGYSCGFMSFAGGFTHHFWFALVAVAAAFATAASLLMRLRRSKLWSRELVKVVHAARPLAGLSVYAVWVSLPIPIIHPPEFGGICPRLPLICHDMPLLGLGGAFWWVVPYVAVAAGSTGFLFARETTQRRNAGDFED